MLWMVTAITPQIHTVASASSCALQEQSLALHVKYTHSTAASWENRIEVGTGLWVASAKMWDGKRVCYTGVIKFALKGHHGEA